MNSWIALAAHSLAGPALAGGFLDLLVKSVVILMAAGGVCLCWRRGAACARHLIWVLAVAGLLGLPCFSGLIPAWQRPLWTVATRADSRNELTLTFEWMPAEVQRAPARPAAAPSPDAPAASPAPAVKTGRPALATRLRLPWAGLALAGWSCGAGMILLAMGGGRLRLRALCRGARPPAEAEWQPLLSRLCDKLRIERRVRLLQSAGDVMPATWGSWRPVILLPRQSDEWPPERRRLVLLHELAHVKRWDCLTQLTAQLACALYWLNPLVWVAARRMCAERERACDDLVLAAGCRASDYAAHLLEIARSYRRVPEAAAIAMARSTRLQGRIAAIVDESQVRRGPRALLIGLVCAAVLGFLAAVAAQKAAATPPDSAAKSWFDARLRAFFAAKAKQAHRLAEQEHQPTVPEVWRYFQAGIAGDWENASNLWLQAQEQRNRPYGTNADGQPLYRADTMVKCPILETDLALHQFASGSENYVLAFGRDIIRSIPPGSIYFGGTDAGRGVITALCESHTEGKPILTLTQGALADNTYRDYLRAMYGDAIRIPSEEDSKKVFDEYMADAQRRLAEHRLKPGEDVRMDGRKLTISGRVAVTNINAGLARILFERNPGREFYIEESFALDWMYPYLSPHGPIMRINRQPLPTLPEEIVRRDHKYWSRYLRPILGEEVISNPSAAYLAAFVQKVYIQHQLAGFQGDPQFLEDAWAQKNFSKLRSSIAGIYYWRATNATSPADRQRMTQEAEFAFSQAYALCPVNFENLSRYAALLLRLGRLYDACLLSETALKLDPENVPIRQLLEHLRSRRPARDS